MRILYHHRTLGDGAEGIHVAEIVNALRGLGHEVLVVCPGGDAGGGNEAGQMTSRSARLAWVKERIPKIAHRAGEILYNVKSYLAVKKAIRRFQPAFMYERYACFSFGGVLAAKRAGVPVMLEVNTPYAFAWDRYDKLYFKRTARRVEGYVLAQSDVVFVVSTALKDWLIEHGTDAEKIVVTPNAVNPECFRLADSRAVREKYGLTARIVVGFVGSLRVWHGIDLLMAAVPEVIRTNPCCHFLIVGSGELEQQLRGSIQEQRLEDHVTFTGRVPHREVLRYVAAMDIALMPNSNFYGSPMKVFEYMAAGKPTIAPRLGPLEEVVQHGVTGILVEPGCSDALVDAILALSRDGSRRQELGERAREYVLAHHTWRHNAEAIVQASRAVCHCLEQAVPSDRFDWTSTACSKQGHT